VRYRNKTIVFKYWYPVEIVRKSNLAIIELKAARSIDYMNNVLKSLLRWIACRHSIRVGIRDRLVRHFDHPESALSEEFSTPFFEYTYFGNKSCFIDWNVYYYGAYSRSEICLIRDILVRIKDPTYLDVGANVGHHVLAVAALCKSVLAFEPYEKVRSQLLEKIRRNNLRNVHVFPYGLCDETTNRPFRPPSGSNTGTGEFLWTDYDQTGLESLQLAIGDEIVESSGITAIDFIKIDVEGQEERVIKGLQRSLQRYQPLVLFEVIKSESGSIANSVKSIFPSSYRIVTLQFNHPKWVFFNRDCYAFKSLGSTSSDGYMLAIPNRFEQICSNLGGPIGAKLV
jgi:FkbM family methyltransferase